jgi:hypothetical protein
MSDVMRFIKRSVAVVLMPLLVACSSTEHRARAYESATVRMSADTWRGYEVATGQELVLESSHYVSSLPFVVDGISGYSLHIELSPQRISKDTVIAIPSEKSRAYLHTLNAPSYKNVEVFGAVRIIELQSTGVSIEADLKSKDVPWTKSGIETYRYARHSCLGKVDWACEFYTK